MLLLVFWVASLRSHLGSISGARASLVHQSVTMFVNQPAPVWAQHPNDGGVYVDDGGWWRCVDCNRTADWTHIHSDRHRRNLALRQSQSVQLWQPPVAAAALTHPVPPSPRQPPFAIPLGQGAAVQSGQPPFANPTRNHQLPPSPRQPPVAVRFEPGAAVPLPPPPPGPGPVCACPACAGPPPTPPGSTAERHAEVLTLLQHIQARLADTFQQNTQLLAQNAQILAQNTLILNQMMPVSPRPPASSSASSQPGSEAPTELARRAWLAGASSYMARHGHGSQLPVGSEAGASPSEPKNQNMPGQPSQPFEASDVPTEPRDQTMPGQPSQLPVGSEAGDVPTEPRDQPSPGHGSQLPVGSEAGASPSEPKNQTMPGQLSQLPGSEAGDVPTAPGDQTTPGQPSQLPVGSQSISASASQGGQPQPPQVAPQREQPPQPRTQGGLPGGLQPITAPRPPQLQWPGWQQQPRFAPAAKAPPQLQPKAGPRHPQWQPSAAPPPQQQPWRWGSQPWW
jgi:hypothetical protein